MIMAQSYVWKVTYTYRKKQTKTPSGGDIYYKVRKGDTLSSISKKLGISINSLCGSNNLKRNSTIRPKQILRY